MNYVAGLLFDNDNPDDILVIKKNRPDWQKGRYNFIGGVMEEGETAHQAMVREFKEETGLEVNSWKHFCTLKGEEFEVYFYVAQAPAGDYQSLTDEHVQKMSTEDYSKLIDYGVAIPNTSWLLNMGINCLVGHDDTVYIVYEN